MEDEDESNIMCLEIGEISHLNIVQSFIHSASKRDSLFSPGRSFNFGEQFFPDLGTSPKHVSSCLDGYVCPKVNDSTLNEIPDIMQNTVKVGLCSKWRNLSTVINSVSRLKTPEAKKIDDVNSLRSTVLESMSWNRFPMKDDTMYVTYGEIARKALKENKEQSRFFRALDRADEKDIIYLQERLTNDPKKHYFEADDKESLPNHPDYRGFTPLSIACRNGNLMLFKLLIKFGANPYQYIETEKGKPESNLAVAAKWNHVELVEYLLQPEFTWAEKDLKKAEKVSSGRVKSLLRARRCNKGFFGKILGRLK